MLELLGFFALLYLLFATDFGLWIVALIIATGLFLLLVTLLAQWFAS